MGNPMILFLVCRFPGNSTKKLGNLLEITHAHIIPLLFHTTLWCSFWLKE